LADFIVTNKTGKKYVTYTADDLDNPGKIYTGRCSGTCDMTPQKIWINVKLVIIGT